MEDKFGIPNEKIQQIFEQYNGNKFIKITGLSIHIGSQIESLDPFKIAFTKIRKQILGLKKGFKILTLDLGGGIGIKYNKDSKIIDIKMYAKLIEKQFSDLGAEVILEPGRYIVGTSGIILTRVIRVKKGTNKNFLIVDAGMNNLLRPALYRSNPQYLPSNIKGR